MKENNHLSIQPGQEQLWQLAFSLNTVIRTALCCTLQFAYRSRQDLSQLAGSGGPKPT